MSDPTSAATLLATLVGLLCIYRQEKGASESLDHQKFIEWLEYHRHEEIKTLICNTAALQTEVDKLLRADHALIIEKLDAIHATVATLMSRVTEFSGLATAMMPGAELSDQAIQILTHLVHSKSNAIYEARYSGGCVLTLERDGQIPIGEPRFVNDDLEKLVTLGLLSLNFTSSGGRIFRITRNAARFVEAMSKKP